MPSELKCGQQSEAPTSISLHTISTPCFPLSSLRTPASPASRQGKGRKRRGFDRARSRVNAFAGHNVEPAAAQLVQRVAIESRPITAHVRPFLSRNHLNLGLLAAVSCQVGQSPGRAACYRNAARGLG